MLDYKDIITKRYVLHLPGAEIARILGVSKSGVNDFLKRFEDCKELSLPLPPEITNAGISMKVYGRISGGGRDLSYEYPDYAEVARLLKDRKNMTLQVCWTRYFHRCQSEGRRPYQYRQFCELFAKWTEENYETAHFAAVIAQTMEVDFAGRTFALVDRTTGEATNIVVFVACLPYSQYIYAEGMTSTREPEWIEANNNALQYFGGVPAIVVCDNCKQAVVSNKDWIEPDLNKDYAEWAEHNHTVILPAKVKRPKYKSSVENSVGILEKGLFHTLGERTYFDLETFNRDLRDELEKLNDAPFKKKEHCRSYYWEEERRELLPLPSTQYHYMERSTAKVSSDFHVRFDNAYYSVDKAYIHKRVGIRATTSAVRIYSQEGVMLKEWPRATRKGEWKTDPEDLPGNYKDYSEWNGACFIRRAMTVGPNTEAVVRRILASRKLEVQTYRLCMGVLGFTKRYSRAALEECCRRALAAGRATYTFVKNSIVSVAEEYGKDGYNAVPADDRNNGAFVMDKSRTDMSALLEQSRKLAESAGKEVL